MKIDFWVDPACPWCWMTARWITELVAPHRDLEISWQPISLFVKNAPSPESDYYAPVKRTHNLLRVMEAVRAGEGDQPIAALYWEFGTRQHHDQDLDYPVADALTAVGLPTKYADAFDDPTFDEAIMKRMDRGLALAGNHVGTPIIAMPNADGEEVALFGPVISRMPSPELALQLWDGFAAVVQVPGFWELKRTRTEDPQFGDRPKPLKNPQLVSQNKETSSGLSDQEETP